jgi:hypothetical protein
MAIDFPNSPTNGQTHVVGSFTWQYDGEKWIAANGIALDGLSDVTVPTPTSGDFLKWNGTAWVNDPINLGTDTTGNYMSDLTQGTGVTITHTPGEGSNATIAIGQSVATSASPTFAKITISGTPSATTDAVTKAYVDSIAAGINWHESVKLATATVLSGTPTYNNGTGGSGATLTATENARLSVDGVPVTTNDRILVKNQVDTVHNGIYKVTEQGSASLPYTLTRAVDQDGVSDNVVRGDATYVASGSTNSNQGFLISSAGTSGDSQLHVIGTDPITFTQFTGTATIIAGAGITKTGNTLSIASSIATNVTGNLTGNADTATTLATSRNIELQGSITGIASFNGGANAVIATTMNSTLDSLTDVSVASPGENTYLKWNNTSWVPDTIDLGTDTTGNYMADISAGTGVTVTHTPGEGSTATVAIGQSVATNATPTFAGATLDVVQVGITSANEIDTTSGNLILDSFTGTVQVDDNVLTTGTITTRAAATQDGVIIQGRAGGTTSLGVTVTPAALSASRTLTLPDTTGTVVTTGDSGTVTSTMISDGTIVNGDINASAAIAHSKLANATAGQVLLGTTATGVVTATTISGDITIDGAGVASIAANSVALGTDTTGNYMSDLTQGTGVTVTHTPGEGSNATIAIGQAVGTSASVTFANLTVTGDLTVSGTTTTINSTAINVKNQVVFEGATDNNFETTLTVVDPTADRTVSLPDASGTLAISGTIALGTDTTGNYISGASAGTGIAVTHTPAEGSTATVAIDTAVVPQLAVANTFSTNQIISGTSTSAMLRVTQLGTGNALLVEDDTNPDATPVVVRSDGRTIMGHTAPEGEWYVSSGTGHRLYVVDNQSVNAVSGNVWFQRYNGAGGLTICRSNGTNIGDRGVIVTGDTIGVVNFAGDDAVDGGMTSCARISVTSEGTIGTGIIPTRMTFTTTSSAGTFTERMRIDSAGNLGIGTATAVGYSIYSAKNITGATNTYSMIAAGQIQSDVTASSSIFTSAVSTAAAAFTLPTLSHFFVTGVATPGAGSTITTQVGFRVNSNMTGATNNYAFQSQMDSGANRFNLYMSGTAANYMLGRLGVGATLTTGSMAQITNTTAADVALTVKGAASQSGLLLDIQNSSGTTLAYVDSSGNAKFVSIDGGSA